MQWLPTLFSIVDRHLNRLAPVRTLLRLGGLGFGLLWLACLPVKAQDRPSQGHDLPSDPAGTEVPSAVEPIAPNTPDRVPNPDGRRGGRGTSGPSSSHGTASSQDAPTMPNSPPQAPIGGIEWLAAAGAVYALRQLGLRSGEE